MEERIFELFTEKFPDAEIISNFKWRHDCTPYETDLLVRFDTQLFIVEAKSGKISAPALRGAIKSTERHLKELILEPAIQAERLDSGIQSLVSSSSDNGQFDIDLPFDLQDINNIVRLSVTFDNICNVAK